MDRGAAAPGSRRRVVDEGSGLDAAAVRRVAEAAVGSPLAGASVTERRSVYRPRVAGTRGVYLVTGTARVATAAGAKDSPPDAAWAAVLKVLAPVPDEDLPYEAQLYASGFLATLRGPLVAPRCYGVALLAGGEVGVWLEHVRDDVGSPWPLAQYARTASHLGAFAGALEGPDAPARLPALPKAPLRAGAAAWDANIARLREHRRHPRVRRTYPPEVQARLETLWEQRGPLLDALADGPHAAAHGDAQRNNLFARGDSAHEGRGARTVAIDWANFRRAPVGTDAATLLHQDLVHFRADATRAAQLDQHVFGGFWRGLHAAGWRGGRRAARAAYALQLALVYGLHDLRPALDLALDEDGRVWAAQADRYGGRSLEDVLDRRRSVTRFLLDVADEARALARMESGPSLKAWPSPASPTPAETRSLTGCEG